MINPFKITDYKRDEFKLQEFLLFAICVAGKRAITTAKLLDNFLGELENFYGAANYAPLILLSYALDDGILLERLKQSSLGQYNRLYRCFKEIDAKWRMWNFDITETSVEELEEFYGIGAKTARFFMLHSKAGLKHVVFDTHLSKWFNERGVVPFTGSPSKQDYLKYEPIAIKYLEEEHKITDFAKFDLEKWSAFARKS